MSILKILVAVAVLLLATSLPIQSFADCQGCCSSHGGVICRNGITMCADGTSLSITCQNKGCDDCDSVPPSPTTDPNDIDDDHDGYTENEGDCNDSNALEFPNQTWLKDFDRDGYSDGTSQTSCIRPTNYRAASGLYQRSGDINDYIQDPMLTHPPVIYSMSPTTFLPNRTLVIKGKHFGIYQGSAYLSFANTIKTQEVLSWSDTQITCLAPLGIQSGCLSAHTNMGTSNCMQYEAKHVLPWLMLLFSEK